MLELFAMIFAFLASEPAFAIPKIYELDLQNLESRALESSSRLKSAQSEADAANEIVSAGFSVLLPRLDLKSSYQYQSQVPKLSVGRAPAVELTTHSSYSIGPALSYTLWDTFSSRDSYHSAQRAAEARANDCKYAEAQTLLALRVAYVRVQLALEELKLVYGSRRLAESQSRDVQNRFKVGAANKLDLLLSSRQETGFNLQFRQKQTELANAVRDLKALVGEGDFSDLERPGFEGLEEISVEIRVKPLSIDTSVPELNATSQAQIRSLRASAEAAKNQSRVQSSKRWPILQAAAFAGAIYPNGPVAETVFQTTVQLSLTMPLFLGDPSSHLAAQKLREADAIELKTIQLSQDLERDYYKSKATLQSLQEQKKLSLQDIVDSDQAASLSMNAYRSGRGNLTDVQSAANQALLSKVNSARIDAQIQNQIFFLQALTAQGVAP